MARHGLKLQKQIGERLKKSESWVDKRLSLVLDVIEEVKDAIRRGYISIEIALIIGQLPKNRQGKFLSFVIETQRSFLPSKKVFFFKKKSV